MFRVKSFCKEEQGVVAVDWFVISAALVGIAVFAAMNIGEGVLGLGTSVATEIEEKDV